MGIKYKRILLKLSGEALAGENKFGLDYDIVFNICEGIKKCVELGAEIGIVVGGGNFWRGRTSGKMDRTRADHMGMLATVMNALALCDALESHGVTVRVQTAIAMQQIAEPYIRGRALRHFEQGRVVIFGCGTGNPFFSTDTAASLRAAEIDADIILKATMVDGIYDSDPRKNQNAKKYDEITFSKILGDNLKVMDSTAAAMCKDNNIPVLVFSLSDPNNIVRAIKGEKIGTLVKEDMEWHQNP
ncbi:MAG: UMP kinase [Oscillospiraceae bacterium]|nr:UMP kinase [Oscillospiraceae bacterium]